VLPLPYGAVNRKLQLMFKMPVDLIAHFLDDAKRALPDEAAAWIVWNEIDEKLEYVNVGTYESSPGGIRYARPRLEAHQHLAVDLHSHGALPAFFSATDDADDEGEVKLAGVLGNIDTDTPSAAFRLCALGLAVDVGTPAGFRKPE
jgi:PRTRC genetic system protein A